jgi:hypothetical protein
MDIKAARTKYDCREEIGNLLGGSNRQNKYICPFHRDSDPSFVVYPEGYFCFGCGEHGDIFDFWAYWYKKPLADILKEQQVSPQDEITRKQEYLEREAKYLRERLDKLETALEELRNGHLWETYHERDRDQALKLWGLRGIPEWFYDYAYLGYDPDHTFWNYSSPTLTFPVYKPASREVVNIRHRLLSPTDDSGKYRPERSGLPASVYYASPELPQAGKLILTEGEIKAMVTYVTAQEPDLQVAGSPSKNLSAEMFQQLQGFDPIYYIPDPDVAGKEVSKVAKAFSGHDFYVIRLPEKIDDMIVWSGLDKTWLTNTMKDARKVRV